MDINFPEEVPLLGFYYHYKHDPTGEINNYAYEVIGVGFHTEEDARPGEEHFLIYRPLYEKAGVYIASKKLGIPCFDNSPLSMWMEMVGEGDQTVPRFQKINDPHTITELDHFRDEMYS